MCTKGFKVIVELDVHAVTCPGVWLCPNGRICLKIKILGFVTKTKCIPPMFPLLFHEKFVFEKLISTCRQLIELQRYFESEIVHAELVQKAGLDSIEEVLLATFEISLTDLLYPSTSRRGVLAGVDIDLLMEPSCHFPGIIAPKVEISTKTVVEEVNLTLSERKKAFINPKTLRSKATNEHLDACEKAKMARLRSHPGTCCYVHPVSHHCFRKNSRPPFVVRHKDERDLARPPTIHNSIPPLPALPCHRWAGKKQHCRMFMETDKHRRQRTKSLDRVDIGENLPNDKLASSERHCDCAISHINGNCTVCNLYKHYFPRHQTEKKMMNQLAKSVNQDDGESKKSLQQLIESNSDSSSRASLSNNCVLTKPKSQIKHFSNYGPCSRLTHELSKQVRHAMCRLDYPFLQTDKECCKPCCHSKLHFVSTMPFKESECCGPSHRLIFYTNLERFHHKLSGQAKSQAAHCKHSSLS